MITEKPQATRAQVKREYPTEWTWYEDDQEENADEGHREAEQDNQVDTVTARPH